MHKPPRQRQQWPRATTLLWWVCGLFLVLAQSVGQMHHSLHHRALGANLLATTATAHHRDGASAANLGISRLFGEHGNKDCLLLDQWTWVDFSIDLLALPRLAPAAPVIGELHQPQRFRSIAAFQARAPPSLVQG